MRTTADYFCAMVIPIFPIFQAFRYAVIRICRSRIAGKGPFRWTRQVVHPEDNVRTYCPPGFSFPRVGLYLSLICLLPVAAFGQIDFTAAAADEALAAEDYRLAVRIMDSLEATGNVSPNFYLVQGNAHYEAGQPGRAIMAYERGLRLRPANEDLRNNLRFVRQQIGIEAANVQEFFLLRAWRNFGALLGTTTSYVISLVLWWLAVAGLVWWYLRRDRMEEKQRFALLPTALLAAFLAAAFYGLGSSRAYFLERSDEAVLLDDATLRVSPTAEGSVEAQLPEGVKLYITDRVSEYFKVQLPEGQTGYLPATVVGVI